MKTRKEVLYEIEKYEREAHQLEGLWAVHEASSQMPVKKEFRRYLSVKAKLNALRWVLVQPIPWHKRQLIAIQSWLNTALTAVKGMDWHWLDFVPFVNLMLSIGTGASTGKQRLMLAYSLIFSAGMILLTLKVLGNAR